jgi:hypothetical protein
MAAQPSLPKRVATASGFLAALSGLLGTASLLDAFALVAPGVSRWHDAAVRAVSASTTAYVASFTRDPSALTPRPAALFAISVLAAVAVWTGRRWLVWTLAVVATAIAGLGPVSFGVHFVPPALLLLVTGLLFSFEPRTDVSEQPDVTF